MSGLSTSPVRLLLMAQNTRVASLASMNDIRDMAHFCVVAAEMLDELRTAATAAAHSNTAITPHSLLAWLDENQPQLSRQTAQQHQQET